MARTRLSNAPPRPAWAETPADTNVRTDAGFLPDYGTVREAFKAYDRGDDAAAKELLGRIGLASEFREWKLVLRGLMAHAAGDATAAEENWKRLTPGRLPAVLIAPLLNPDAHRDRADKLLGGKLAAKLRKLLAEIGRDRPLAQAFKTADALLPDAAKECPAVVPHVAAAFYAALPIVGEQTDLATYRKLFGPPKDDPHFHRLEATAFEQGKQFALANGHWTSYELWLAGNPLGWPADLLARARATLHDRIGRNWLLENAWWEENRDNPFARGMKRPKPVLPDASFRRAMELAPGWALPLRSLVVALSERGQHAEAMKLAADFCTTYGDQHDLLMVAAKSAEESERWPQAVDLWLRALAANPLDKGLVEYAGYGVVHAARHAVVAGDHAAASAFLARHPNQDEIKGLALRVVLAKAAKDPAAVELERKLAESPRARLAGPYLLSVDAGLAKLKPAEKRKYADAFKAALEADPTPGEVNVLFGAFDSYPLGKVKYRGVGPHEKQFLALIPRAAEKAPDGFDAEAMLAGLGVRQHWKVLEPAAAGLVAKYPKNPVFKLWHAEALHALNARWKAEKRIRKLLDDAEPLWATHQSLLTADARERAESLGQQYRRNEDFLEFLFGRR